MNSFWLGFPGSWPLFPVVPRGLPPRPLLSRRCRSLRRVPVSPCLSRGMKTLLGLLNNKLKWSGSECPYQRPVMPRHLLLGRGPAVPAPPVRGPAPLRSTPGPTSLLGPAALPIGPTTAGPMPVLPPPSSSQNLKNTSSLPPHTHTHALSRIFSGATPPFIPMALASSANVAAPPQLPQDPRKILQGPTPEMVRSWKAEWFKDIKLYWQQLQGDAPPQSTEGPAVSQGNMGPDALRQLSPSAHGLSISPVQNELAVILADTVAPARGPLLIATGPGTADLLRHRTPPPRRDTGHPLPNALAETDTRGPMTVAHLKAGSVLKALTNLGPLALQVTGVVITLTLLHLSAGIGVARLPLVGPTGPARLRGLLGAPLHRLCGGHHLIDVGLDIPHRTVTHRLRPVLEGLIIVYHPLFLGRLHPKGPEPRVSLRPVTSPGLSAGNVTHIPMIRIFVSCVCGRTTMNIILLVLIHVVPLNQDNHHPWMNLLSLRQRSKNFSMIWSRRQHYRTTPTQSRIVSPITN